MNTMVLYIAEYLAIGLVLFAAGLFLAAALGTFIKPESQKISAATRPVVTLLRYVKGNHDADHALRKRHVMGPGRCDQVLICESVDTKRVKQLRAHYADRYSKVYAPRQAADLSSVLKQAYARSRKGDHIIALPVRFTVSDNLIDNFVAGTKKGDILWMDDHTFADASVSAVVGSYVSIIRKTCQDATGAIRMLRRGNIALNTEKNNRISDLSFWILMSIYALTGMMTAIISTVAHQPVTLMIFWLTTVLWLIIAAIGSNSLFSGNRMTAMVALPLAPLLLWAYVLVYPATYARGLRKRGASGASDFLSFMRDF